MFDARRRYRSVVAAALAAALFAGGACFAQPAYAAPSSIDRIEHVAGSQLFENGVGFAWGTSGGAFVIARTADNGRTWSRLDLSSLKVDLGALAPAVTAGTSTVFVHFAGPTHGWVVWATKHLALHIASTDDDGASWTATTLPYGDGVTGWTFRTPTDGFIAVRYPPGVQILLYRTADGGRGWQDVDVPLPAAVPAERVDGTFPEGPTFSGPGRLDGEMRVGLFLEGGMVSYLYRTTDGGLTWHVAKPEK